MKGPGLTTVMPFRDHFCGEDLMWIKNLHLENWLLFDQADIELDQSSRVIGIVGRYADGEELQEGRSNRSGKSSLVEAIRFLLYGAGRHRSQTKLINRTALERGEGMSVRGTLVLGDGAELEIGRGRGPEGDPWVEISGHEGLGWKDANRVLEDIVGFSLQEYDNTCYFGQGDIHGFMASPPKEKRTLILSWLGQERWGEREAYAKDRADHLAPQIDGARQVLAGMVESRDASQIASEVSESAAAWEKARGLVDQQKAKVSQLRDSLEAARRQRRLRLDRDRLREKWQALQVAFKRAEESKKARDDLDKKIQVVADELKALQSVTQEQIAKGREELAGLKRQGQDLGLQLQKIEGADGVCPLLLEGCDRIGSETVEELEKLQGELRETYTEKESALEVVKTELDQGEGEFEKELDGLQYERGQYGGPDPEYIQEQILDLEAEAKAITGQIQPKAIKPEILDAKLTQADDILSGLEEQDGEAGRAVAALLQELNAVKKQAKRKKELEEKVQVWEKDRSAWSYCRFMFSPRGIPGDYLQGAFETMEGDINFILERLGTGLQVELRPYRETKTWEPQCLACGLEYPKGGKKVCPDCGAARQKKRKDTLVLHIHDTHEGQESEFDLDSGGGQVLISFAVRLALLLLKIREGRDDPPPIILDEVVGSLDAYHREAILDLVLNVLPVDFGFQQIWWISHIEEVQSALETNLVVVREGERSRIEWG